MSNQRPSSKPKSSVPKKTGVHTPSSGKSIPAYIFNDSNNDKTSDKADTLISNFANQVRDFSNLIPDSALEGHLIPDLNSSELSIIKMLTSETPKNRQEESEEKKLKEEVTFLRKDLEMKNKLVEKLMQENSDLHMEMEVLLSTVGDAKEKINEKLKFCDQRVQELEAEINKLKEENRVYQEQLQQVQRNTGTNSYLSGLEDNAETFYNDTKKRMNDFYEHLNSQIVGFINSSRTQYESYNSLIQDSIKEAEKDIFTKIQIENVPQGKGRYSNLKLGNLASQPNIKNASKPHASPTSRSFGRTSSGSVSARKERTGIFHNLDDLTLTNRSESSSGGETHLSGTNILKKTPKSSFTPKIKSKVTFKAETSETQEKGL